MFSESVTFLIKLGINFTYTISRMFLKNVNVMRMSPRLFCGSVRSTSELASLRTSLDSKKRLVRESEGSSLYID